MRRELLKSIRGIDFGQDDEGNVVSNRIDMSQIVVQMDADGTPSIETTTADGNTQEFALGGTGIDLATNFSIASPHDAAYASLPTMKAKIQAAIDSLRDTGGIVQLRAQEYVFGPDEDEMAGIVLYNNVCLEGVSSSVTKLTMAEGTIGFHVMSYPELGSAVAVGGKHWIRNIQLDGDNVGVLNLRVDTTANSATVTNVDTFGDGEVDVEVGFLFEADGSPDSKTFIQSFDEIAGTITLSQAITNDAVYTNTNQRAKVRPAFTVTATGTLGSPDLTVTSGDYSRVVVGMLADGTRLDSDEEDLNANSRVKSINGNIITLDRDAKSTGSFLVTFYVRNDGIYGAEVSYNEDADPGDEYRAPECYGVMISNYSGTGCNMRSGRDQFLWGDNCKSVSNSGKGIKLTASNDSKIHGPSGEGSNWEENICVVSSSTCRIINFDVFDSRQPSKFYGFNSSGNRQLLMFGGEINGPCRFRGKGGDEANHGLYLINVNFKWHSGDGYPDHSYPQYILVNNGAHLVVSNCYFYNDHSTLDCPDRLIQADDDAVVQWYGSRIITDVAADYCPFQVEVYATSNGGKVYGSYLAVLNENDSEGTFIQLGAVNHDSGILYQDSAIDRRVATEGGTRTINDQLADQRIAVTSDLATYAVKLPFQAIGSKPLRVRFAVDGGSIASLTWQTVREDGTVDTLPGSPNFDTVSQDDLPKAIYGNTTVNLWWAETTEKWECTNGSGRYIPWTTVASSTSITLDADTGSKFELTLTTTNATLANPNHMEIGEVIELRVIQGTTAGVGFAGYGNKLQTQGGFAGKSLSTSTGVASILVIERGSTAADKFFVDFSTPYTT